jgi:hypothetical protein
MATASSLSNLRGCYFGVTDRGFMNYGVEVISGGMDIPNIISTFLFRRSEVAQTARRFFRPTSISE